MSKQIIILEQNDGAPSKYRVVYWLTVVSARQSYYARAGAVSVWKGASQLENDAIAAGAIFEVVDTFEPADGTNVPALKASLQAIYTAKQSEFDASNRAKRYGSFFDPAGGGDGWTIVSN